MSDWLKDARERWATRCDTCWMATERCSACVERRRVAGERVYVDLPRALACIEAADALVAEMAETVTPESRWGQLLAAYRKARQG